MAFLALVMHCKYNLIDKNKVTCISPTLRKLEIQCVSSAHYQRWALVCAPICPHKAIHSGSPFSLLQTLRTWRRCPKCARLLASHGENRRLIPFTSRNSLGSGAGLVDSSPSMPKSVQLFRVYWKHWCTNLPEKRLAQNLQFSAWMRANC